MDSHEVTSVALTAWVLTMVVVRGMQMSDRRDRRRRVEEEHNTWRSVVLVVEDIVHLVFYILVSASGSYVYRVTCMWRNSA
jgi:hypothetical protein